MKPERRTSRRARASTEVSYQKYFGDRTSRMLTWVLGKPVKHWALQADRGVVGMPSKDCVGRFENLSHNPLPGSGSFLLRWESAQHLWVEMQNAGRTARVRLGVGLGRSWAVLVVRSAPCELFDQPQAHTRDMLSKSLDMETFPYVLGASCLRHCCMFAK